MNCPKVTEIIEARAEAKDTKTFLFKYSGEMIPGQFFMIWIPGVDEIPMSISYVKGDIKGITFRKVGSATEALSNLKKGDSLGIRGPYGNGFKIEGERILFVAGGTGIAMIASAIEKAIKKKIKSTVILGVKNEDELFFEKRIEDSGAKVFLTTDDGSRGHKGFATDIVKDIIKEEDFSLILTCGPEIMMKSLLDIVGNIPLQASLERYMKCGVGLCGQCCIGKGLRVCKDGPIFDGNTLRGIEEFGKFKRDAAGRKIPI